MNTQQLRAQIVALQEATMDENKNFRTAYDEGKFDALTDVNNLLDSMQEVPVSEDLEAEIKRYYVEWDEHPQYVQTARHFARWQKGQDQETIELAEYHAMLAGMEKAKEQIMKNLWKPVDGDDLPEYEREVVAFQEIFPTDVDVPSLLKIVIAHRPNPEGYDGKSLTTEEVEHYTPKTYDKGGWNIPDIVYWLDVNLPKEIEL